MKPIVPARVVGGSVLVEGAPIASSGIARVFRGVDLGDPEPSSPGPAPGADGSLVNKLAGLLRSPYRRAPPEAPRAPVPVIVRELNHVADGEPEILDLFERVTLARHRMTGSPAPRLLHTFGREGRVRVSVEEHLGGATLGGLLRAGAHGFRMPVEIALSIGRSLLSLWFTAEEASPPVRFSIDPTGVRIDADGRVRVIPEYGAERARQAVGAAVFLLSALVSYIAPEQIMGTVPGPRSAMYTLGLLLYEMLTGAHPVATEHSTMFEILSSMANREVPSLPDRRTGVHPAVIELVHRCLARDPTQRFSSWRELSRAFGAVQGLFPRTGPADIARYLAGLSPPPPMEAAPTVADPNTWGTLVPAGYVAIPLPERVSEVVLTGSPARPAPAFDPAVVYAGGDARPMYEVSARLWIDARPVTRAEIERFHIVARTPRSTHRRAPSTPDDDPCTDVSFEEAEAYARWAGKRLPTEGEWAAAVAKLGAGRLGVGQVWEWTVTRWDGGRVVCGHGWRDPPARQGQPVDRSVETSPAADVGFRCVSDAT